MPSTSSIALQLAAMKCCQPFAQCLLRVTLSSSKGLPRALSSTTIGFFVEQCLTRSMSSSSNGSTSAGRVGYARGMRSRSGWPIGSCIWYERHMIIIFGIFGMWDFANWYLWLWVEWSILEGFGNVVHVGYIWDLLLFLPVSRCSQIIRLDPPLHL